MRAVDPADVVSVHDRVDRDHQRSGHRHGARDVQALCAGGDARARNDRERENDDEDPDRNVDEEDPVPVEDVGEDSAEKNTERASAGGDEAEDAHRLRPLGRLGEQRHHQRESDGRDDRGAEPLHGARDDEHLLRGRQTADRRGDGEERDAGEEQAPMPEEVAEPAAEEQEPAERDQVRIDDPRQPFVREPEVLLDRRQSDADDGHVEHDHQVAQAEDEECEPAGSGVGEGHVVSFLSQFRCLLLRRLGGAKLIGRSPEARRARRPPA